ncbi:AraC family transcriptional regulator [Halioxenophilus sp. WMMB6]|uniref:AraC family transcriptional regulator n=1 Tax=Halioxenophilus sp. WMMB6 TaxID=3073815 RepID=UPI00295E86B3|nr:AraC family transcriptional regulator ligand-binding domain-containing protein [Halioxenophilus sp. WMMB6]
MPSEPFFSLPRPLHLLPEPCQVRAANLEQLPQLITRLGGDYREILARHNLEQRILNDSDHFIDCRVLTSLFEDCAESLADPLFGLHLAEHQQPEVYGSVLSLCRAAATLRDALACLIEFLPITHCSESVLTLVEGDEIAELCWAERTPMGANTQANFQGLWLNLRVLQAVGGTDFRPSYVCLPDRLPAATHQELQQRLNCPVRLGAHKSAIAFASQLLPAPVASANGPLFQLLYAYMYRLKAEPRQSVVERVQHFIARQLAGGDLSIEACGRSLNLPLRTLQARLHNAGKTYSGIVEQQRLEHAKYVLLHSSLSIAEIADSLGYAERTSFGRAFRRWTGLSPHQYRLSQGTI